jgi:hypothetical protein
MPRTLAPTIAGCAAVAALVLAAPNPATATAGSTTAHRVEEACIHYYVKDEAKFAKTDALTGALTTLLSV